MTDQSTTEPQDLETVPDHHNDLGDYCPSSGQLTADGTCPQYCREADERAGFDAGRDEDEPEPETCSECGADLAGNRACKYTTLCQLRQAGWDPVRVMADLGRALGHDVASLTEYELGSLITVLKATVVAAEIELGNNRDRAKADAELARAQRDHAPRH